MAARYRREIRAIRERVDSLGSQVIETEYGPIEYTRTGEGYLVLVVHGVLGGFDQGLILANQYIDSGFQIISVSRFGYLRSPLPTEANVTMQADAFACLLGALNIEQVAIFGASSGATSSIRLAARHPERVSALILHAPAAPGKVEISAPPRVIFDLMRSDFVSWALCTYLKPMMQCMIGVPKGFILTPESKGEVNDLLAGTLPSSERIDGLLFDIYLASPEIHESVSEASPYPLRDIKTPVLVTTAVDDPLAIHKNVRDFAGRFSDVHLFIAPDGGHLFLGHTEEVRTQIIEFLRKHTVVSSDQP